MYIYIHIPIPNIMNKALQIKNRCQPMRKFNYCN